MINAETLSRKDAEKERGTSGTGVNEKLTEYQAGLNTEAQRHRERERVSLSPKRRTE